ncbi:transglutaminase-like cysteine peptidase [Cobetia sp. 5-25-4-2]|uniref:transglutaminase-like cysteine peptidase n=1 Tax=Cobetia sp. 5-25-4-2 TaxID=2737459 RepID=UPI001C3F4DA5|nr:transglutaminase-like cysteine peptidase [Cobetia sp. 5-25-4-2]
MWQRCCFTWLIAWVLMLFTVGSVLARDTQAQRFIEVYGQPGWARVQQWEQLLVDLDGQPARRQLSEVNDFFNRMHFTDDMRVWGKEDYWATPLEFLGAGAGDCDDFAMAKYLTLRQLGVPESSLRLHYVKALRLNQFHMVVTYQGAGMSMPDVLDNLNSSILPASERTDLLPIYSFNGNALWMSKRLEGGERISDSRGLSSLTDWQRRYKDGVLKAPLRKRP